VAVDQVDVAPAGAHAHPQRAAAHRLDRVAVVADLDGLQALGEVADVRDVAELKARQEAHPDAAPIGQLGTGGVPVAAQAIAQVLQRPETTDLLHAQHVGRELADHPRQLGQLGVVGSLVAGTRLAGRTQQVLEIPRGDDHRTAHPPTPPHKIYLSTDPDYEEAEIWLSGAADMRWQSSRRWNGRAASGQCRKGSSAGTHGPTRGHRTLVCSEPAVKAVSTVRP
jgi:hypothetical protein